jgi:antitoxin ParD1/3/4
MEIGSHNMTSMNITLPEPMRQYIEDQITSGSYGTASEYMRTLIRDDQKRKAQERLESLLLEGLDSGDPIEATPEFWLDLRNKIEARRKGIKA